MDTLHCGREIQISSNPIQNRATVHPCNENVILGNRLVKYKVALYGTGKRERPNLAVTLK